MVVRAQSGRSPWSPSVTGSITGSATGPASGSTTAPSAGLVVRRVAFFAASVAPATFSVRSSLASATFSVSDSVAALTFSAALRVASRPLATALPAASPTASAASATPRRARCRTSVGSHGSAHGSTLERERRPRRRRRAEADERREQPEDLGARVLLLARGLRGRGREGLGGALALVGRDVGGLLDGCPGLDRGLVHRGDQLGQEVVDDLVVRGVDGGRRLLRGRLHLGCGGLHALLVQVLDPREEPVDEGLDLGGGPVLGGRRGVARLARRRPSAACRVGGVGRGSRPGRPPGPSASPCPRRSSGSCVNGISTPGSFGCTDLPLCHRAGGSAGRSLCRTQPVACTTARSPVRSRVACETSRMFATLHTTAGDIRIELYPNHAPRTVENFAGLATGSTPWTDPTTGEERTDPLYNGVVFHRVISGFMIQGGDPLGTGRGGPGYTFDDEIHPELLVRRALPARHGQRRQAPRPGHRQGRRHQRLAVLHLGGPHRVAQRQAHDLRQGRRRREPRRGRRDREHAGRAPATARSRTSSSSRSPSRTETTISEPAQPGAPVAPPVCPRHPDRVSYVRCQRCGRPTCPECQRQAAGRHPVRRLRRRGRACAADHAAPRSAASRHAGRPVVTLTLIGLCVVSFVLQLVLPDVDRALALLPGARVLRAVAVPHGGVPALPGQYSTSSFNMVALWFVGPTLESTLGRARFITLYLMSAVGGAVGVRAARGRDPQLDARGASGRPAPCSGCSARSSWSSMRLGGDVRGILGSSASTWCSASSWRTSPGRRTSGGLVTGAAARQRPTRTRRPTADGSSPSSRRSLLGARAAGADRARLRVGRLRPLSALRASHSTFLAAFAAPQTYSHLWNYTRVVIHRLVHRWGQRPRFRRSARMAVDAGASRTWGRRWGRRRGTRDSGRRRRRPRVRTAPGSRRGAVSASASSCRSRR